MMCSPLIPLDSSAVIEESNHETRNALTPGLSSLELLESHWDRLTPQQRQKHFNKIRNSINGAISILEKNNEQIEQGKVVLFRRKAEADAQDSGSRRY